MGRRVNVIGVGMTKFAKPGASEDYNVMAAKAAQGRARGREGRLRRGRAGVRRLRLRRQHVRPARGLRARPHRHPGVQREQQLLDRLDRALCSARQAVEGGLAECVLVVGFEKMEKGALGSKCDRPHEPARQARRRDERRAGLQPGAARRADVRRRGPRVPLEVRHEARDLRARSARRRASTRRTTRTRSSTSRSRVEEIMASRRGVRSAHALPVLPADVRRGRGDPLLGRLREEARHRRSPSTSRRRR